MHFTAFLLPFLAGAALASPVTINRRGEADHIVQTVDIDQAIYNRIDKAFQDAAAAPALAARASGDTRNDLNEGKCDDIIVIFARGTYGSGNLGTGVGPAFVDAVSAAEPGRVIVQGVLPYPALVIGYLAGGSEEGAESMVALTQKAATQCPSAQIIWGGYSQGAQVTHKAAAKLPTALYSKIAGIVLFGDPYDGDAFPGTLNNNVRTFCNDDDPICDGLPLPIAGHLTYDEDAGAAGAWVAALV